VWEGGQKAARREGRGWRNLGTGVEKGGSDEGIGLHIAQY